MMLRERRLWKVNTIPIRFVLPNVLTLLALCSGVTSIRLGIEGRFELAVAALMFAVMLDALDGRVARLLQGSSRFGAELDSLADFVNFGVAPALLMYMNQLWILKNLGWIFALGLAVACALRLARFNIAIDDPTKPPWANNFFVGVPAPAGGALSLAPMYLDFLGWMPGGKIGAAITLLWLALIAFLMVSRLPIWSGKLMGQRISREYVLPLIAVIALSLVALVSYPWECLTLASALYLLAIPWSVRSYQRYALSSRTEESSSEAPSQEGSTP